MRMRWWIGAAILALALYFAFAPGIANPDTIDIIGQGITGRISDWHSPAASLFAGLAAPLGMPNGFLIVQTVLAASCACYLGVLTWRTMSRRSLGLSALIALVSTYAVLLIVLASVYSIKDMWIALLLVSAGLLLYRNEGIASTIVALFLCATAVLIRPISIFPTLPLIAIAIQTLLSNRSLLMKLGATIVAVGTIATLPAVFVTAANAVDSNPETPTFVYDIVGVAMQMPDPSKFLSEAYRTYFRQ